MIHCKNYLSKSYEQFKKPWLVSFYFLSYVHPKLDITNDIDNSVLLFPIRTKCLFSKEAFDYCIL